MMGEIDICWNDRIERVVFPLPKAFTHLSETTKESFITTCNISTRESRLKDLMDNVSTLLNKVLYMYRVRYTKSYYIL